MQGFSGESAIAGIGMTALTRESGLSELELAAEAARTALDDAGMDRPDAVLSYHMNDSAPAIRVAQELGMETIGWHNDITGGGTQCASILGDAAMLIANRVARNVLIYRSLNGRSGKRMNTASIGPLERTMRDHGAYGPIPLFALAAQRYLHDTGLDERHLHAVVAASRAAASDNPRALRHDGLSFEDYRRKPYICAPLRNVDCCQETDGACALVVTASEAAPEAPRIHAVVRGGGPGVSTMDTAPDVTRIFSGHIASALWKAADMGPEAIDVALLYDAYSWLIPRQLEDFGLVPRNGLGERLLNREHVVVNPHGGLLSEGYVHGLNNVAEAVRQVRTGRRAALVTGFGGSYGSAAILKNPRSRMAPHGNS